jgi:hypothetical protein
VSTNFFACLPIHSGFTVPENKYFASCQSTFYPLPALLTTFASAVQLRVAWMRIPKYLAGMLFLLGLTYARKLAGASDLMLGHHRCYTAKVYMYWLLGRE